MSFRYKIALTFIAFVGIVSLIVLWAALSYLEKSFRFEMHQSNAALVQSIVEHSAKEALTQEEYGLFQVELEKFSEDTSIDSIVLTNNDGKVLAANDLRLVGTIFEAPVDSSWHVEKVVSGVNILGRIVYSYSGTRVKESLAQARNFGLIIVAVGLIFVAGVGMIIGSVLANRIERIAQSTDYIRNGDIDMLVRDESKDEVGQLNRFIFKMTKKQYEHVTELEANREKMRLALEIGGVATWSWDFHQKVLNWSAKYYQSLGILPSSAKPDYKLWLARVHPNDKRKVELAISQMVREYKDLDIEFRIVRPTGGVRWVHNIGRVQFDRQGHPCEIYGMQIDISRFKEKNQKIEVRDV